MHTPKFWRHNGLGSGLLAPAGWAYAAGGWLRFHMTKPERAPVPVVCVGNLVAGGAGKTPAVLALAEMLWDQGPHALSRGYGGRLRGPVSVDPTLHGVDDVGDEPLLLAQHLPTWVSRDRVAGAQAAAKAGAGLILMDDGFQNPALTKDVSLLVVDGEQGFGSRRCLPAGPLREPMSRGLARADAVILVGEDTIKLGRVGPVFRARIAPSDETDAWQGRPVIAFAGIARPEKFFATLRALGADIRGSHAFADHHRYREADLAPLAQEAGVSATLITTEKDHVRLPPEWRSRVATLPVAMQFEDRDALAAWLQARLEAAT